MYVKRIHLHEWLDRKQNLTLTDLSPIMWFKLVGKFEYFSRLKYPDGNGGVITNRYYLKYENQRNEYFKLFVEENPDGTFNILDNVVIVYDKDTHQRVILQY